MHRHGKPRGAKLNNESLVVSTFYKKIKRNISEDGLIVGSSSFLVNSMMSRIDFSDSLRILEIGSGKGPFTRELIRRMSPESSLDVCEIKSEYNPWIERLIQANPAQRVVLYNGCVTELLTRPGYYDVIVSSLPLKNFTRMNDANAFLYQLLGGVKLALSEGGIYLQYQYFRSNLKDIETVFGKEMARVDFVPLNILPAFVYSMIK